MEVVPAHTQLTLPQTVTSKKYLPGGCKTPPTIPTRNSLTVIHMKYWPDGRNLPYISFTPPTYMFTENVCDS